MFGIPRNCCSMQRFPVRHADHLPLGSWIYTITCFQLSNYFFPYKLYPRNLFVFTLRQLTLWSCVFFTTVISFSQCCFINVVCCFVELAELRLSSATFIFGIIGIFSSLVVKKCLQTNTGSTVLYKYKQCLRRFVKKAWKLWNIRDPIFRARTIVLPCNKTMQPSELMAQSAGASTPCVCRAVKSPVRAPASTRYL